MLDDAEPEITAAAEADLGRSAVETVLTNITPARIEAGYARRRLAGGCARGAPRSRSPSSPAGRTTATSRSASSR